MNKEEILSTIKFLANSQGFYGRVLSQIEDHPEVLDVLEEQNFDDVIDLIMYFEQ